MNIALGRMARNVNSLREGGEVLRDSRVAVSGLRTSFLNFQEGRGYAKLLKFKKKKIKSESLTGCSILQKPNFESARLENLFCTFQAFNQQVFVEPLLRVQGARDRPVYKTNRSLCLHGVCLLVGKTDH